MTSSKSNKHSLMSPTKSKKPSTMAETPSKSKKPSTMAPKLHQPPPVVEEHHEDMTEGEENQPEEDSVSESESGSESGSVSASSEEKTAEEEQEEEEDEDDEDKNSDKSDSDSEESADEIAFTVQPVVSEKSTEPKTSTPVVNHASTPVVNQASTPVVNHTSSSKRSAESESVPNESKRKKLTDNGDEHDAKKGRVWTEEDELAIFNGLIAYQKRKKGIFTNADIGDFHQFIKKNLHLEADDGKLSNKIKRLKSKYFSKGQDQVFTKPHDIEMFELSKKIWGVQDIVVDDSARRSNQKPKSRAVSQAAGARSNQKPKSMAVSEAAGNKPDVAEMKEEVKFAGGAKTGPDDFWLKYPSLSLCLSLQRCCDLSSQLRQKIPMLGSNKSTKLEELEKEWSDIQVAELELGYKKDDVRMKMTKFVLDLMDSGSKE